MQPTYTPVVAAGMDRLDVELADAKASCSGRCSCQNECYEIIGIASRSLMTTWMMCQ